MCYKRLVAAMQAENSVAVSSMLFSPFSFNSIFNRMKMKVYLLQHKEAK